MARVDPTSVKQHRGPWNGNGAGGRRGKERKGKERKLLKILTLRDLVSHRYTGTWDTYSEITLAAAAGEIKEMPGV